jgi:chromosome segregation ATPase
MQSGGGGNLREKKMREQEEERRDQEAQKVREEEEKRRDQEEKKRRDQEEAKKRREKYEQNMREKEQKMREKAQKIREEAEQKRREEEAEQKKKNFSEKVNGMINQIYGIGNAFKYEIDEKYDVEDKIDTFLDKIKKNGEIILEDEKRIKYHITVKEKTPYYEIYANLDNLDNQPKINVYNIVSACSCRREKGFKYGWCGYSGFGVPDCEIK